MKLFFWSALDIGGEYADAYIAVVARSKDAAVEMVEQDAREWIRNYSGHISYTVPDVLTVTSREKARVWMWG